MRRRGKRRKKAPARVPADGVPSQDTKRSRAKCSEASDARCCVFTALGYFLAWGYLSLFQGLCEIAK